MGDKMGVPNTVDTPESRNGHGSDLAQLATDLRSSFDARLPPFKPAQTDGLPGRSGIQDQLSEALKKHHRYTPVLMVLLYSALLEVRNRCQFLILRYRIRQSQSWILMPHGKGILHTPPQTLQLCAVFMEL